MAVTKKQQVNIVHHWHCWATTHCGVWLTSSGPESRLSPKLMTLPESQISMHTLIQATHTYIHIYIIHTYIHI